MAAVITALVILAYILILIGLTIWLKKYHYYKNTFFNLPSQPKKEDSQSESTISKQEPHSMTNQP